MLSEYALATELGHPKSVNLREDDLLPQLDTWLAELFGEERLDETCAAMAGAVDSEPVIDTSAIKAAIRECDRKLDRYRKALEAGTDPTIVAEWIRQVTKERAAAEAEFEQARLNSTEQISVAQLRAELEAIGGLLPLLEASDPELKARLYEEVGLEGTFDPEAKIVEARVLNGRVGGGTCNNFPCTPPATGLVIDLAERVWLIGVAAWSAPRRTP